MSYIIDSRHDFFTNRNIWMDGIKERFNTDSKTYGLDVSFTIGLLIYNHKMKNKLSSENVGVVVTTRDTRKLTDVAQDITKSEIIPIVEILNVRLIYFLLKTC